MIVAISFLVGSLLSGPLAVGQSSKSVDEQRLERFWADYYQAVSRFYAELDRLDWVAYYKHHGTVIDDGSRGNGRVRFVPMMVVPRMEPIVAGPLLDGPAPAPVGKAASQSWVIELQLGERTSPESQVVHSFHHTVVCKEGEFRVSKTTDIPVPTAKKADSGALAVGVTAQGRITSATKGIVRLELTLECNELENASKSHVLASGRTFRLIQKASVGERVKVVLQSEGEATRWLEFRIVERKGPTERLPMVVPSLAPPPDLKTNGDSNKAFPAPNRSQIHFRSPAGMRIHWVAQDDGKPSFTSMPLEAPGRYNFNQGAIYRLKLTDIPGHPGLDIYPTLEVVPTDDKVQEFLAHNSVPLEFSKENIQAIVDRNYLVKVVYLPDSSSDGTDEIDSTRLQPDQDPVQEALKRGSILAVIRVGNVNLEMPHAPRLDLKFDATRRKPK
jgi:hypothetical protein